MLPPRRSPATVGPLLIFPPSPPSVSPHRPSLPPIDHSTRSPSLSLLASTSQHYDQDRPTRSRKKRSLCYRVLATVPLGFIYFLLLFSFYTIVYSLTFDYLIRSKGETIKAFVILASYGWLLFGCGGSLWMCYYKNEDNFVKIDDTFEGETRDEEERIGGGGLNGGEIEEEEEEDEGTEQQGLLNEASGSGENGVRRSKGTSGNQTRQVKADGTQRFCRKCNILKPDRAHHCSTCQRCVMKMDHHCPWLGGGCAGYATYKFFLQFLLYTGALGIYIAVVCFYFLINYTSNEPSGFEMAPISWALAALLGAIFGAATGLFGMYHIYLAANNRTTIEAMESPTTISSTLPPPHLVDMFAASQSKTRPRPPPTDLRPNGPSRAPAAPTRAQLIYQLHTRLNAKQKLRLNKAKRRFNVYDLGWRGNLKEVFTRAGDLKSRMREGERGERDGSGYEGGNGKSNWWEWIVPWGSPAGDGHSYPINVENLRKLEEVAREIWAEVEAEERERSKDRSRSLDTGRWESGLTREGGYEGENESERSQSDEDDRPLRRA
ncbi:hypothetical protein JCM16303_004992 [Sporobolomyces ruberrimus]